MSTLFHLIPLILAVLLCGNSRIRPEGLRTDYVRKAGRVAVLSSEPMFSWLVAPKSVCQDACRIQVASSREKLLSGTADMWDSGKLSEDDNFVRYGGRRLEIGKEYFWRVKYWGKDGESRFSDACRFVMGEEKGGKVVTPTPLVQRREWAFPASGATEEGSLYDFGKAAFATLYLKVDTGKEQVIEIRVGEKLAVGGGVDMEPGGTVRFEKIPLRLLPGKKEYTVLFKKNHWNTSGNAVLLPDSIGVVLPFRYVQVLGFDGKPGSLEFSRKVPHGYGEPSGSFVSSDKLLDSIWELCRYTVLATDFLGYYVDGDRERRPYEADAYINQLSHYCVDAQYAVAKRTLEHFMTRPTWPTEWLLHTHMIAWQDYCYTGDTRLIEKYYDVLKSRTLHGLAREDGLISSMSKKVTPAYLVDLGIPGGKKFRDIVDWPKERFAKGERGERDMHEMRPYNTVVNCFYCNSLKLMAGMASVVGREEDRLYFTALHVKVRNTINEKLFDKEKGLYIDGEGSSHSSLHSNMLPLAFGLVDEEHVRGVVDFIKSRKMACSVYGAQYLFEALYRAGEDRYALELMTNRTDRGWYNMLRSGSTMTLEAWDMKYKSNLDWNHAWGAAPANLIPRMMWGITPVAPGFRKARIKPQLADLQYSGITVPTLRGDIVASYRLLRNGDKRYVVEIPPNMDADFVLPEGCGSIEVNGEKMKVTDNVVKLEVGENRVRVISPCR